MQRRSLFLVFCLTWAATAPAKHVYQYTDANGIVHYTDQKPGEATQGVKSTLVRTDHQPLIRMREDGPADSRRRNGDVRAAAKLAILLKLGI